MEKGDSLSFGANTRSLVDEAHSSLATLLQRSLEVVHGKTDVMNAWTPFFEELSNGRVGFVSFEEFDQRFAGVKATDHGAVAVVELGLGHSEDIAIE